MFWLGLLVGLFFGMFVMLFLIALCNAAGDKE